MNIYLRADTTSNVYKREGYDILSYLGDLGGLLDIVLVIGSALAGFLTSKKFTADLIS